MKISKFKEISNYKEVKDKNDIKNLLTNIQDSNEDISINTSTNTESLQEIKTSIENLPTRTDETSIFNQKVEEDLIIMETPDELFSIPQDCKDFFNETTQLPEISQFFILSEEALDDRCVKRKYNFDLEQPLGIRQDSYIGDPSGFIKILGSVNNQSADITIVNDTYYKVKLRIGDSQNDISIEDGFSLTLNDIEKENEILFKRDHTISGYTLNYVIEGKLNA